MCLLYKRLHQARLELPSAGAGSASVHIDAQALAKLLAGVPKEVTREKTVARARTA